MSISVVLLAGGVGKRMGGEIPKQFLQLKDKPVVLHSLDVFLNHPEVLEVVVVCEKKYRTYFDGYNVLFAEPGERRQDSLYHGFKKCSPSSQWICVHDGARPFIDREMLDLLFREGMQIGAATVGMPVKWTVKETSEEGRVIRTLDRERVWEIQTPQFLKRSIMEEGFAYALANGLTVTDDVSLAELIGCPVKVVRGSYQNLKITTPEDLFVAECININS